MKVQPLREYRAPTYPTMQAASLDPELLARVPERWRVSPHLAALLGAGLCAELAAVRAAEAAPAPQSAAVQPEKPAPAPAAADAAEAVRQAGVRVAPMLAEALQRDGRGSFGCVAIDPPSILSEEEAVELIRKELEAAGLHLQEDAAIPGEETAKAAPVEAADADAEEDAEVEEGAEGDTIKVLVSRTFRPRREGERSEFKLPEYAFDFADVKRGVYVEYLSVRDHRDWAPSMSTADSVDFPAMARELSAALSRYNTRGPVRCGVFFDPLARADLPAPDLTGLSPESTRLAGREYAVAMRNLDGRLDEVSKEKLREQVRNFIAYLRKEGVLDAKP